MEPVIDYSKQTTLGKKAFAKELKRDALLYAKERGYTEREALNYCNMLLKMADCEEVKPSIVKYYYYIRK